MKARTEHYTKNSNPVLSVEKDGTILYSNEAAELLLIEWGVEIGEKLLSYIGEPVQRVITRNNPEKMEVKVGKRVYLVVFHPLLEQERVSISGFDISDRKELEVKYRGNDAQVITNFELSEIIDVQAIQSLMEDFYKLAQVPIGIIDLKGNVLVGVGWQDICTKFHRVHPKTCRYCVESDTKLSAGIPVGKFKPYKCKNNMWDIATPIMIGSQHIGNIFLGQFFFEGEIPDYELFRSQAKRYGFDEDEYIAALEKVPRFSQVTVNTIMVFFMKFANMLSQLSYSNIKLAQLLAECDILVDKLQENRKDFDRAQAVGNIGSWRLDICKNELTWSDENHRIFGIPKGTPLTYETFLSTVHPDDREYVDKEWKAGLEGEQYDIEHRLVSNGKVKWVREKAYLEFDKDRAVIGSFGITQDITDRKKAEEALEKANENLEEKVKERTIQLEKAYNSLKESEKSLSEAQKMAHIGNWDWNLITDEMYWSDEMYRIFGQDPLKFASSYNAVLSRTHPDDLENVDYAVKRAFKGAPFSIDHRIILAHGENCIVHAQGEVVFDEKDRPVRMRGTVQDITERKKAEERIQILANIVESSEDAIGTVSIDGTITSWNQGAERVYGYLAEEISGKCVSTVAPSHLNKETISLIEKIKQGEKIHQYETLRLRKDGKTINVSITLSPVFDIHGKLTAVSFISRDITEHKKTEEALKNFEIARQKEIHHRIKNNLQVVSSLLDLQSEKFKGRKNIRDSEVLNAFTESIKRVLSIALIHEGLYKGEHTNLLNFSQYIKELAENLILTYKLETDVSFNFDMEEKTFLDMDTAIPLGIIINELITNSFKYAFSGRDKGEIRIKLHRDKNGECKSNGCKSTDFVLAVSDDGIGIPEDLSIEDLNSLGLQLVTSLVEQLDGKLKLKRDNGTEFNILFTVTEYNDKTSVMIRHQC